MSILDYIKGNRKGRNARKIELQAMKDPFLADAIEGFDSVRGNHADKIAQLQAKINSHSSSNKNKKYIGYRIAAAAIVAIALLSGYFTLMNHQSSMLSANETDGMYINIYAPEEYIDKKRAELTEIQEQHPSSHPVMKAVVDIQNLNEVIKPFEPMNVYIPDSYAEMQKGNIQAEEELLSTPNKQTDKLYAIAEKTNKNIPEEQSNQKIEWSTPQKPSFNVGSSYSDGYFVSESNAEPNVAKESINNRTSNVIKGKVLDQNGEPLIGVSVTEKGSNVGTITDIDGNYTLNTKTESPELIAKYIGFEPVTINNPKNEQDITLKEDRLALEEVVVVGYGTQKKSSLTGSISSVKANDESFYKRPSPSVEKALEGRVAGVQISKQEDNKENIKIRGISSLDSTKESVSKPVIGEKEYRNYLNKNKKQSQNADCKDKKGKVIVEFSVDSQGNPVDIKVTKGLCDDYNKEAVRLIQNGSKWTISKQKAKIEIEF